VTNQIKKTTDKNHNRIKQINEELKAKRGKNQKAQEVLKISDGRSEMKDQNPLNNLQTLGGRKNITEDQTTANKELAKKREILHLEST
jgi:hypothetical protein